MNLDDPGWERLLLAARRKLERTGGAMIGNVGISKPTDEERRVIIGITGRHRAAGVTRLQVGLADVDTALQEAHGSGLRAVLAEHGGPLRNRPAEQDREERGKDAALADLAAHCPRHRGRQWFTGWLQGLVADGTATRLVRRGEGGLFALAGEVLNRLPGDDVPLPVLAERATGSTKALSGTPLAGLVQRGLAAREGTTEASTSRAQQRARWESAGVIVDDLASQVLVLNLRPVEQHPVATWLREAATYGLPFRLTLQQLVNWPMTLSGNVFVCENPAVVRTAAAELAEHSAPLVCTEGQPSAACHKLLAGCPGPLYWRGDFDWTGLRTTAMAMERYAALPWRMGRDDYLAGIESGDSEALRGPAAPSPWSLDVAAAMADHGRAVMEERLLPSLLEDLDTE